MAYFEQIENDKLEMMIALRDEAKIIAGAELNKLSDDELVWLSHHWITYCDRAKLFNRERIPLKVESLLSYRAVDSACGCLGPQDGAPWCPCSISYKFEEFALEISLYIKNNIGIEEVETV